jgi:hypothetical protein
VTAPILGGHLSSSQRVHHFNIIFTSSGSDLKGTEREIFGPGAFFALLVKRVSSKSQGEIQSTSPPLEILRVKHLLILIYPLK